jgi:hypothetical protein
VFANLIGQRAAEIGVDGERLLPVAACLAGVLEGVPGAAEAAVGAGLLVFQADPGGQVEGVSPNRRIVRG